MSTAGVSAATRRRTPRAGSRAGSEAPVSHVSSRASSRAGSEETDSVTGERGQRGTTPRRSGRLAAQSSIVGNKESAAYGAKAKPLSNPEMSANAHQDVTTNLAAAVEAATARQPPTDGEAGPLPVITEEHESNIGSGNRSREPSVPTEDPRHDDAPVVEDVDETHQGNQTICSRFRAFMGWAPRDEQEDHLHDPVHGFAGGFAQNLRLPWQMISAIVLSFLVLLIMATLQVDLYTGPRLGPNIKLLQKHLPTTAVDATVVHDGRLSTMERLLSSKTSKSSISYTSSLRHQINWFAPGNGARIEPYMSSPTYDPDRCRKYGDLPTSWKRWLSYYIMRKEVFCLGLISPFDALTGGLEPHERWCAPPSRGKLQLTIRPPRPISPTELVIEHLPKDASIIVGNAPKEVELWVDIPDQEVRGAVLNAIQQFHPELLHPSSPQSQREVADKQALTDDFLCVGRWTYDIWGPDHIQTFKVPFALKDLGVKSQMIAVRATANWGDRTSTCIYRARLHADDMSGWQEIIDNA